MTPQKKTDLGVHSATIILKDDNRWVLTSSYKFKIIIGLPKEELEALALAIKKKKGGNIKLNLDKETLRPNGELIIKIRGDICPAGLIS